MDPKTPAPQSSESYFSESSPFVWKNDRRKVPQNQERPNLEEHQAGKVLPQGTWRDVVKASGSLGTQRQQPTVLFPSKSDLSLFPPLTHSTRATPSVVTPTPTPTPFQSPSLLSTTEQFTTFPPPNGTPSSLFDLSFLAGNISFFSSSAPSFVPNNATTTTPSFLEHEEELVAPIWNVMEGDLSSFAGTSIASSCRTIEYSSPTKPPKTIMEEEMEEEIFLKALGELDLSSGWTTPVAKEENPMSARSILAQTGEENPTPISFSVHATSPNSPLVRTSRSVLTVKKKKQESGTMIGDEEEDFILIARKSNKAHGVTSPPRGTKRKVIGEDENVLNNIPNNKEEPMKKSTEIPILNKQQHVPSCEDDSKKLTEIPKPVVESTTMDRAIIPFFGPANSDTATMVLGTFKFSDIGDRLVQERLTKLKSVSNDGYGVVPITNSFTLRNFETKGVDKRKQNNYRNALLASLDLFETETEWDASFVSNEEISTTTPIRKQSGKNLAPPSPNLPTTEDIELKKLILYQVGFPSGRQALFQGLCVSKSGEHVSNLINQYIVLNQDDGLDIGIFRGYETLTCLVPRIPEVPFMRILRRATSKEIQSLSIKAKDEATAFHLVETLLHGRPNLNSMKVRYCEFQCDRNKLIVYTEMKQWLNFNELVHSLHGALSAEFGYQSRVFIQRKFVR